MSISRNSSNFPTRRSSTKSFGFLFSIIFFAVALYPLIASKEIHLWAIIVSALFLLFTIVAPQILNFPNSLWFKLGELLGTVITPVVMALIFLVTIIPTGLIMRLLGKELLKKNLDKSSKSYWIVRNDPIGSMKNQY